MAGVKGMKHRRARPKKASDHQVLASIENRLRDHALGENEMSPTQVMAARAVYDKLRPTLSAIESTQLDPRDKADPQQLAARLAAMFAEKPALFEQVLALRSAASAQQAPNTSDETRVTH